MSFTPIAGDRMSDASDDELRYLLLGWLLRETLSRPRLLHHSTLMLESVNSVRNFDRLIEIVPMIESEELISVIGEDNYIDFSEIDMKLLPLGVVFCLENRDAIQQVFEEYVDDGFDLRAAYQLLELSKAQLPAKAPASDRFVSLGDNRSGADEAADNAKKLAKEIRDGNEISQLIADKDERLFIAEQVESLGDWLKLPKIDLDAVRPVYGRLQWIVEKLGEGTVYALATALVAWLATVIFG